MKNNDRISEAQTCKCNSCFVEGTATRVLNRFNDCLGYQPPQGWYFVGYMDMGTFLCAKCMFDPAVDPDYLIEFV